ncbi:MAG: MarR family transcriptional regulator [Robiginitomaculum sp.]|nr:MarR family transcriptional regulator [Robiginitomaculum sp.]
MYTYYMPEMITKHEDLLGTLIHDVAHLLRCDIDSRVKRYNLTRVKWLALGIIEHRPNITQRDLAIELELGSASVGRLVDRLESRGFISRKPAPNDRRANCLSLKPEASKLLQELRNIASEMKNNALQGLSADEVKAVNSGLLKIKQNLKGLLTTVIFSVSAFSQDIIIRLGEASSTGTMTII